MGCVVDHKHFNILLCKLLDLIIFAVMSLPLRITFEGKDYTYRILTKMIDQHSKTIQILLEDQELTIFKNSKNEWDAQERTINDNTGLIKAIARSVALRYRL